jgi:hypothetical protein
MKILHVITLPLIVFLQANVCADVVSINRSFHISDESGFDLKIPLSSGEKAYELRCHPRDYENDPSGHEYFGVFQCILDDLREESGDLFEENYEWSKSYRTRGVFHFEQMVGPCKNNLSYGLTRRMSIRDLEIELKLVNLQMPDMAEMIKGIKIPSFSGEISVRVSPAKGYIKTGIEPTQNTYCSGAYQIGKDGSLIYIPEKS